MTRTNRLLYLANARLPTEKAHGYQISKMCEAFALSGAEVLLLHPYRRQADPNLRERNLFDYYGVQPVFQVRTLRNWDVVLLNRFMPDGMFTSIFFAHALLWGYYAAQVARQYKADLYYTRDAPIAYWLVRMGLPTAYEAHVVPKRGQRWLLKRISGQSALRLVVVLTSFIRDRFLDLGFPRDKVVVSPDGVDLNLFENLPSREECRRQLGLPLERPIIGYIGRFRTMDMEKGIPELIEALKYLESVKGQSPLLLCVGGPMNAVPTYRRMARRFGVPETQLKFVDRVPSYEVPCWIRSFDLALAPFPTTEHYARFMSPLKIFEYMASGVSIVATDLPSIREVLKHGENAWLVPPGDPRALAQGLRYLLENRNVASRLARKAKEDVQRYTWNKRAGAILQHVQSNFK